MPEINQYSFTHKELAELMIKKAGIHDGKWMFSVTFAFGAINGGPAPDQMLPTGVVGVQSIGLQKATPDTPPSLVVDAAEVNPAPASEPKQKRRRV